jgi:hypothetical protein
VAFFDFLEIDGACDMMDEIDQHAQANQSEHNSERHRQVRNELNAFSPADRA